MPGGLVPGLNWRDGVLYAPLLEADPPLIAWEWLRRRADYVAAARAYIAAPSGGAPCVVAADPAAACWGLHVFEDPARDTPSARPIWHAGVLSAVLRTRAVREGPHEERFDLRSFAAIATVAKHQQCGEHVLVRDGGETLRMDVLEGSVLEGPVRLAYLISGISAAAAQVAALHGLLRLCRTGRLRTSSDRKHNRRLVMLLRAYDGLRAGATQREIATVLLSREPVPPRWRSEEPSLRLRAQRLSRGARAMAAGGYLDLLSGRGGRSSPTIRK